MPRTGKELAQVILQVSGWQAAFFLVTNGIVPRWRRERGGATGSPWAEWLPHTNGIPSPVAQDAALIRDDYPMCSKVP
jgi:hypothetical protein